MYKRLWIIRGIPGSGKTTAATFLANGNPVFSADSYFEKVDPTSIFGFKYEFDITKLGAAHKNCQNLTEQAMVGEVKDIFVANTFTTEKEMKEYFKLAEMYSYTVFSLIVENRHGNSNVHSVPDETLKKMRERFTVKL